MPIARMSSLVNLYTGNQIQELAQTPLLMPSQSRRLGEQAVDHAHSLASLRTDASPKEAGAHRRARAISRNDFRNDQCKFIATGHSRERDQIGQKLPKVILQPGVAKARVICRLIPAILRSRNRRTRACLPVPPRTTACLGGYDGLVGKHAQQFNLPRGEVSNPGAGHGNCANWAPVILHWNGSRTFG